MPSTQGSRALLQEPVAQHLLHSTAPARLAYVWSDGTPRVIPIAFHWNGSEVVLGTPTDAPKLQVLTDGTKVALTIDSDRMPYQVLLVRGSVRIDVVSGLSPEYRAANLRSMGAEAGQAWNTLAAQLFPQLARICITPEWVGLMDFETRFPSAVERAMATSGSAGG